VYNVTRFLDLPNARGLHRVAILESACGQTFAIAGRDWGKIAPQLPISTRASGDSQGKTLGKMLPETPYSAESGPKVLFQGMKSVGGPDIDIYHHGSQPEGSQCALADRHRMLALGHGKSLHRAGRGLAGELAGRRSRLSS
jgi:hypothetical protein